VRDFRLILAAIVITVLAGCGRGQSHVGPASSNNSPQPKRTVLFEDVYSQSGIDFVTSKPQKPLTILETIGHGAGLIDYDGDGLLDLVLVGPDRVRLYRNLGNFHFSDVTSQAGFRQPGYWGGVAVGDVDNDGKPDLLICGYDCTAFYHNEGGGRFREVTKESELAVKPAVAGEVPEWRTSAGFFDFDNDGKLDIFVCRYAQFGPSTPQLCGEPQGPVEKKFSCSPDIYTPQTGSLYHNLGGGRFEDVTARMGLNTSGGRSLGVAFADYNGDGWIDIAIANDERPGDLFENQSGKRFVNQGPSSATAYNALGHNHGGMGIDWGDYNGDGLVDLFVTTYQNEAKSLYKNLGHGSFTDCGLDSGLAEKIDRWVGFGTKFFDYDRDAYPDLIVTSGHVISNTATVYPGTQYRQPVQLFHNNGGTFEEVTARMGPKAQQLMVGRALVIGDLNNDGLLDAIVTQNEGPPMILANRTVNSNHWMSLRLVGTKSNRDGFGAHVVVQTGSRKQVVDATNSGSYMAAHDPRLFFGLGAATRVDSVEIRWPSGLRQSWKNLAVDCHVLLTEGRAGIENKH
jgi:hypothetical protein